jgi:hypothetical protein
MTQPAAAGDAPKSARINGSRTLTIEPVNVVMTTAAATATRKSGGAVRSGTDADADAAAGGAAARECAIPMVVCFS